MNLRLTHVVVETGLDPSSKFLGLISKGKGYCKKY
jgi:hypothetical protein